MKNFQPLSSPPARVMRLPSSFSPHKQKKAQPKIAPSCARSESNAESFVDRIPGHNPQRSTDYPAQTWYIRCGYPAEGEPVFPPFPIPRFWDGETTASQVLFPIRRASVPASRYIPFPLEVFTSLPTGGRACPRAGLHHAITPHRLLSLLHFSSPTPSARGLLLIIHNCR